jgi:anti-sigma-28 factor FlgM
VTDSDARAMKINALKGRIARDEYVVDVHAVAEAMIRRLRAARAAAGISRNGARSRAPRAPRRPS